MAKGPLDPGHDPLVRVEEAAVHLRPAVEAPLLRGDREQPRRFHEPVALRNALEDGPVALVRERPLGSRRPEVLVERRGGRLFQPALRQRCGRLDQEGRLRDVVLGVNTLLLGVDRVVLVREQNVGLSLGGDLQRRGCAVRLDGHVVEELLQVLDRLVVALALAAERAVGGHYVPAGAARGERVRRDHLHVRLDQVAPALYVLRVPVADDEDDDRVADDPLVRIRLPVLRNEALAHEQVDVGIEREVHDVGGQTGRDGASLITRGAVRLVEADAVPRGRALERRDDLAVGVLGGRIGDEVDRRARRSAGGRTGEQGNPEQSDPNSFHSHSLFFDYVHGVAGHYVGNRTIVKREPSRHYSWRRGAARPLDHLAVRGRRARRLLLPALRASDRGRGRARARRPGGRRGAPLPLRLRGDHRAGARVARARPDDCARGGRVLRDVTALRRNRLAGPEQPEHQ